VSKEEKLKQYTIRLRKELMEAVDRTAQDKKTTKTEIIRRAILSYLENRNPEKDYSDASNS
jgi:metal-responsive CopG/Arc/MetJ family transcriptional regulator